MKVISPKVELIDENSLLESVELVGRVSYKSENKITTNSANDFVNRIIDAGHWAVLEFGTIYWVIPDGKCPKIISIITNPDRPESRGSRVVKKGDLLFVTTNLRAFHQIKYDAFDRKDTELYDELVDATNKYATTPDPSVHKLRATSHWISSVAVSNQAMRSRVFSQMQESQRYCNYSKNKFGNELTFIIPYWAYEKEFNLIPNDVRGNILNTTTTSNENWGTIMWEELKEVSKKCRRRDDYWKSVELEYMEEIKDGMLPEEARDVLDKQVKTEFYLCGFLDDWFYEPPKSSPEKAGFFSLRTAQSAQGDIRDLAKDLKSQMEKFYAGPNFIYQTTKQ